VKLDNPHRVREE